MAITLVPLGPNGQIGSVRLGGQELPVTIDRTFWNFLFFQLFNRVGGQDGLDTAGIQALAESAQAFAEAEVRRTPIQPRAEDPVFRNPTSTAPLERQIDEMRAQLSSARSAMQQMRQEIDELRAQIPRKQDQAAIFQAIEELRAATS